MLVWGDVTNHTDFMPRHLYWIPASDIILELGLETRLRMLAIATTDNLRVSAFHGPFPGVGHIRQISAREYLLVPRQWTEDMNDWLWPVRSCGSRT